jgi:hypothetical protein
VKLYTQYVSRRQMAVGAVVKISKNAIDFINSLFFISLFWRLFYDHFNVRPIKSGEAGFYPHFMHKVIHSFCG